MNPEILKNSARDKLVDALIIGGNVMRCLVWSNSVAGIPPTQASISYYPDLHESDVEEAK